MASNNKNKAAAAAALRHAASSFPPAIRSPAAVHHINSDVTPVISRSTQQ